MRKVLTDALVKAVRPPQTGRLELVDLRCAGLAFRVTITGARSWCFRFRDPGNGAPARHTIGRYPDYTLAKARKAADALREEVAQGRNPVETKRRARVDSVGKTFKALAAKYLDEHARPHKRSHALDDRNLRLHVLPTLGDRPYAAITRGEVHDLLQKIKASGKPITANRVKSLITSIFYFAINAGLLTANPCQRMQKPSPENRGERTLTDDELRLFWPGIVGGASIGRRIGLGLRLALLTGCRVGEIAGIARSEISYLQDDARAEWLIPSARIKNGRAHLVPLSKAAREIVLELMAGVAPDAEFLIPNRFGTGPITGHTLTNAAARFAEGLEGTDGAVASWLADRPTAHDLRRTVETRLSSLGVAKEDRDAVLNHVNSDIGSKHYDRYDRVPEKRRALNLWGSHLEMILTNQTAVVLPMTRDGGDARRASGHAP